MNISGMPSADVALENAVILAQGGTPTPFVHKGDFGVKGPATAGKLYDPASGKYPYSHYPMDHSADQGHPLNRKGFGVE